MGGIRTIGVSTAIAALALGARAHAATPGAEAPGQASPRIAATEHAGAPGLFWQEHFEPPRLDWQDPFSHTAATLSRVYSLEREGALPFLHALYDGTASSRPPALHIGKPFLVSPASLDKVRSLQWRWRVLRHPSVKDDAWDDVAASVYVIVRKPSVFTGGRGFKFGWLAKPGKAGEHQHGILEVQSRTDGASPAWQHESVDLCALYRNNFGACEGEKVLYIGVVTDGDNTHSVAEADYADFELSTRQ